jgi:hypothetical protein
MRAIVFESHCSHHLVKVAVLFGVCLASALPAAQFDGSLTDFRSPQGGSEKLLSPSEEVVLQLRAKLAASDEVIASLQKNLTASSGEAYAFRCQAIDYKLRFEALGIPLSGSQNSIEQRLLASVNDLRLVSDKRSLLRDTLVRLCDAVLAFERSAVSGNADARLALEVEMRGASKALSSDLQKSVKSATGAVSLTEGSVVSIREDLALIVGNFGATSGVKSGMPFRVSRGAQLIATVRVVDVRERIFGAVIENLNTENEKVRVGDHLSLEARQ